jgi:hypothetical protein
MRHNMFYTCIDVSLECCVRTKEENVSGKCTTNYGYILKLIHDETSDPAQNAPNPVIIWPNHSAISYAEVPKRGCSTYGRNTHRWHAGTVQAYRGDLRRIAIIVVSETARASRQMNLTHCLE